MELSGCARRPPRPSHCHHCHDGAPRGCQSAAPTWADVPEAVGSRCAPLGALRGESRISDKSSNFYPYLLGVHLVRGVPALLDMTTKRRATHALACPGKKKCAVKLPGCFITGGQVGGDSIPLLVSKEVSSEL
jgi:hypothetical protein